MRHDEDFFEMITMAAVMSGNGLSVAQICKLADDLAAEKRKRFGNKDEEPQQ